MASTGTASSRGWHFSCIRRKRCHNQPLSIGSPPLVSPTAGALGLLAASPRTTPSSSSSETAAASEGQAGGAGASSGEVGSGHSLGSGSGSRRKTSGLSETSTSDSFGTSFASPSPSGTSEDNKTQTEALAPRHRFPTLCWRPVLASETSTTVDNRRAEDHRRAAPLGHEAPLPPPTWVRPRWPPLPTSSAAASGPAHTLLTQQPPAARSKPSCTPVLSACAAAGASGGSGNSGARLAAQKAASTLQNPSALSKPQRRFCVAAASSP